MSWWEDAARKTREQMEARRARVLAQPAIAKRLCEPPLSYASPQQWTGYIPPSLYNEQHNDSPRRAALIEILQAVIEAERDDDEPEEVF